jgi:CBS domain-containing protein
MNASELQPIEQFLQTHAPFDLLSAALIERCARGISIGYYAKTAKFVEFDPIDPKLYLVRSGAFEVRDPQGVLVDRVAEGECFGFSTLLSGEKVVNKVAILEDGLVYHIAQPLFVELRVSCRQFDTFFTRAFAKRLRNQQKFNSKDLTTTSRITTIMSINPACIDVTAKVQQAAQLMQERRVSSVLVVDSQGLAGILTDRDLRNRVLAQGLDGQTCTAEVMTIKPQIIGPNALIFEAMLLMSEHNIHHLPVIDNGQIKGVITSTDILRAQSSQPLLLIGEIDRQETIDKLIHVSKQIPLLLQNLISADARAEEIGRVLTSVTDALTRRLIVLNQRLLGEAPMAFCWLAFGSQGRQDQAACSDQDNGLLLAHEPDEIAAAYFDKLTHGVCKGLDLCGYIYCPGDIMAQNPTWRLSLTKWQNKFKQWVASPDPKALMHASIFFDMRAVYGPQDLFDQLQDGVLAGTKGNDIFLAAMAGNSLQQSPPLGFFRKFVLERDGSEVKGMDLKHKGSALINDIARVYALSAGIKEVNTAKRIQILMQMSIMNRKDALNLADAHEFIAHMRLANQGYQANNNLQVSNFLKPQDLSSLVRHQLRDAFNVVHDAQSGLKLTFLRRF